MTAREYLTRYRDAVRESREIELKITQLRLRYGAPSAINYSDMPKAHNNSDLSDYMEKLEELTERLHVSPGTLSYWINAEEIPSYVLKRISEILRVPVENLVGV